MATGRECRVLDGKPSVAALAFVPAKTGLLLAVGDMDGQVHLWDVGTGQCKGDVRGHGRQISTLLASVPRNAWQSAVSSLCRGRHRPTAPSPKGPRASSAGCLM